MVSGLKRNGRFTRPSPGSTITGSTDGIRASASNGGSATITINSGTVTGQGGTGLVSAVTLIILNWLVSHACYHWPRFERLLQGEGLA